LPVDPLIAPFLNVLNEAPRPPRSTPADAIAVRRQVAERTSEGNPYAAFVEEPPAVADVHEEFVELSSPTGRIPVSVYRTEKALAGAAPGALVMFHGGGWFMGDREGSDNRCRTIAAAHDLVVVNVEYRLAPEYRFPTPGEDCYQATVWTAEHATRLGVAGDWLAVAGESAGGNLAAVVALMARDRGGPRLALQILEIPGLDLTMSSPSVDTYAHGYVLDRDELLWCAEIYLGDHDPKDPLASPVWAADVAGLPPAVIFTSECDPLTDDGSRYATLLSEAGVPVRHKQFPGHVHGSHTLTRLMPTARAWRDSLLEAIGDSLGAPARG
jgi:acetyl esterase